MSAERGHGSKSRVHFLGYSLIPRVGQGVRHAVDSHFDPHHFSVFAAKKHRKPKPSMLFGAGGVTRTHDLLITKCIRALRLTVFRTFESFPSGILRTSALSVPLLPSAHFPVWVSVWVKPLSGHERGKRLLAKRQTR